MSRTGKKPIAIPEGVEVKITDAHIEVKGPHGKLTHTIPFGIRVEKDEQNIWVKRISDSKKHRSLHGLNRTLVSNMVEGVSNKFTKTLEIVGVGYRATKQGEKLTLNIGLSHPVIFEPEENLEIDVPSANKIVVSGIDKQKVGNLAARIRRVSPPDPYKGKGIKYEEEYVRKKVGKAGK